MSALVKDLIANVALTEHCIASDDSSFKDQCPQQSQGGFGFVGAVINARLAERAACRLVQDRQQMKHPLEPFQRAAKRFAVERRRLQRRIEIGIWQTVSDPIANRRFKLFNRYA